MAHSHGIELVLQNQEVMFGDSATFRLRLHDDTDEAGEWTRDDVTLTQSEKTHISINGRDRQLTVTDVHLPDTGEYAYRVGEDMTSAHLSINEAYGFGSVQHPSPPPGAAFHRAISDDFLGFIHVKTDGIELGLRNSIVMLGDSATFRLRLHDDTEEAGEWTRDDVTLTHSNKTQTSINGRCRQLTVIDVHPPDTGEYAYRVGEEMTSAHLSMNEAICYRSVLHPPPPPIIPI
ncbi:myosin-binding protein C, fast-type-like isoform X2 [Haliotis rufescens]|uniref:myosin-binding protein C, fast-type-like isoform X2 n=1 Tax=Haliotis rufescens TaxID=6454 RepID=UPI00201F0AE3|nr:myosin-binding protein C, fast-type-like isoform X2 [Haliotis rufescens]